MFRLLLALLLIGAPAHETRLAGTYQDPVPTPIPGPSEFAKLVQRCLAGDAETAQKNLAAAIEADYPAVHRFHASLPAGPMRDALAQALGVPDAQAATLLVTGTIRRLETIQGGVIDYHTLLLHLEQPEVLRADAETRAEIETHGTVAVLRGTSSDTWLASTLRRDLERLSGRRTFVFKLRELRHPAREGAPERGVHVLEYTTLPAAAANVLR